MKIITALLILFVAGCNNGRSSFTSPPESEITGITAQIYNRPDGGQDILKFEFPKSYYSKLLKALDRAEYDSWPKKWQVLGNIEITHASGKNKIKLFWTGKEVGAFRVDDSYYRGSSDSELIQLIADAKQHQSEQAAPSNP